MSDFHPGELHGGHVVAAVRNCLAGRRTVREHLERRSDRPGAFAELIALPMTNAGTTTGDRSGLAASSTVQAALLDADVPVLGRTWIARATGELMACPVAQHAGARYVVVTDVNQSGWARESLGATLTVDVRATRIDESSAARHERLRRRMR